MAKVRMKAKNLLANSLLFLVAILISLLIAELALRVLFDGQEKQMPPDYRDSWRKDGLGPGGYLQENFSGMLQDGFGSTVRWQNNAQGFRSDKEFLVPPPANTFRILSMGDSFTGGYRVGQEETFSFLVERALADELKDTNVEVMISVIEEPLTGLYYLVSQGVSYEPDMVLLGITLGNDLAQNYWNMGPDYRLVQSDPFVEKIDDWEAMKVRRSRIEGLRISEQCLTPRDTNKKVEPSGPEWSAIEGTQEPSRFRLVSLFESFKQRLEFEAPQTVVSNWEEYLWPRLFDSNGLGILLRSPPPDVSGAYDELFATLSAYSAFSKSRQIELLVVIFPQRFQVQDQDWRKTLDVYQLRDDCFDRELPNRRIMEFCGENGINCLDPTQLMRERYEASGKSLYLPRHDMHWNARGQRAVADALLPALESVAAGR